MLRKRANYYIHDKKFFPLYKNKKGLSEMKKNSGDVFEPIEVDPISGEYFIKIPEHVMNELSWYEDTEICFTLDGNEVILSEREID